MNKLEFSKNFYCGNIAILVFILIFLTFCQKDKMSGQLTEDQDLANNLYANSHDTILIGNSKYIIKAGLSRDFFPGGPVHRENPLIADISLINLDSIDIPTTIDIIKLYVINQKVIWVATLSSNGQIQNFKYKLEKINANGPEWDTGILVDVIVEVKNNKDNMNYLFISKSTNIDRLE